MTKYLVERLAAAALVLAAATTVTQGAAITSAPFSIGLGYSANQVFDNTETSGANTPTTIGDFSFSPTASSDRWSSRGVTFVNRVLADGPADNDYSANIDTALFGLPVTASYNGAAPGDVSGTPDYKLRLEITSVSIRAGAHPSSSLHSLAWDETTPGHLATSPSVNLPVSGDWDITAGYGQVAWDPADFDEPLGGLNNPYTRTFDILGGNGLRFGDGIEVEGVVHLIYNAIPEPASLVLVGIVVGLASIARRRNAGAC